MREICYLCKRNMLVFMRDYGAVFFSVLSMLIILLLQVVFLGEMNVENILWVLSEYGGVRDVAVDERNAEYLVNLWTLAGILIVNTVTVSLTVIQTMIRDEVKGQLALLYVAPVKRIKIALSYILSSGSIGSGMSLLTFVIGQGYLVLQGNPLVSMGVFLKVFGIILLNAFVYATIGYLLALFVHSESAWGGLLTVIGTLVGFLGGIYLPVSQLTEGVVRVLKCLPVLHGTAMMREIMTKEALEKAFAGLPEVIPHQVAGEMGITLWSGEIQITMEKQILLLVFYGIIAIIVAAVISRQRTIHDKK
ncbi:MAG: ABC transporter permease [Lachnospiraceae bacterium]|nr:ABC transporter permease [Lachnospiraceae bacterium]